MFSLTPGSTPADTSAVFALIALITDPAAAQKCLDELKAENLAAVEAHENAKAAVAEAEKTQADAASKLAEAQRITDEFNGSHETRTNSLDERQALLATTDERLKKYEAQTQAYEKEMLQTLGQREESVKVREADVTSREAALRILEAQAQELKENYENKVNAFREAMK